MKTLNLIVVISADGQRLLMCRRRKEPYTGLYNFVGGKLEPGEDSLHGAYRELFEETALTAEDITLTHLMDLTYYQEGFCLEVYAGALKHAKDVIGEENELVWLPTDCDFFDSEKFAGKGNIGHILHCAEQAADALGLPAQFHISINPRG